MEACLKSTRNPYGSLVASAVQQLVGRLAAGRKRPAIAVLNDNLLNDIGLTSGGSRWACRQPFHLQALNGQHQDALRRIGRGRRTA